MEAKDIINFRNSVANLSKDELECLLVDLNNKINQMILDSDLVMKVAIVNQLIEEKKEEPANA